MTDPTDHFRYDVREGRFQRWLSLVAGGAGLLGGLEVAYEHYRGSYSRRVMYTPVVLSGALAVAGVAGFFSRRAARTVLPAVSVLLFVDAVVGFGFHVQGVQRKPGGWRFPVTNVVMGPPIFAPLLLATSAYLGLIAAGLRRGDAPEDEHPLAFPRTTHARHWARALTGAHEAIDLAQDVREGRFQRQMAAAAVISAFLSGFEAWYSHYKNAFRYRVQWSPLIVAPALMLAGGGAMRSVRVAHTWLPLVSVVALANGTVGFGYHLRGVLRRPGGLRALPYNVVYGPPVFAPLLFSASGFLGLLASLLRREP